MQRKAQGRRAASPLPVFPPGGQLSALRPLHRPRNQCRQLSPQNTGAIDCGLQEHGFIVYHPRFGGGGTVVHPGSDHGAQTIQLSTTERKAGTSSSQVREHRAMHVGEREVLTARGESGLSETTTTTVMIQSNRIFQHSLSLIKCTQPPNTGLFYKIKKDYIC